MHKWETMRPSCIQKKKYGKKYCLQIRGSCANIYLLNDKILMKRKGGPAMQNNMTAQNKIRKQEIKGTALFICH